MYRHLKIFLILILFIVSDKIFSNQLSQVEFYSNSKFLSPNNDGYNDEIIFYVILHQNLPIKVKEWSIYILNYESRIITILAPQKRVSNEKSIDLLMEKILMEIMFLTVIIKQFLESITIMEISLRIYYIF
jgi:hypothetical protein